MNKKERIELELAELVQTTEIVVAEADLWFNKLQEAKRVFLINHYVGTPVIDGKQFVLYDPDNSVKNTVEYKTYHKLRDYLSLLTHERLELTERLNFITWFDELKGDK